MFKRDATAILLKKAKSYPVVVITGPRQSGKSTLSKSLFPEKKYISLEDLDVQKFAQEDPRGFLAQFPEGAILDEVQHVPHLFSYIQTIVDDQFKPGMFILTGSQQFGLTAKITQSLAGRAGFIQLLPFTISELKTANALSKNLEEVMFKGLYPPVYDRNIPPHTWYNDYILTYIERDVRQLINVQDLRAYHRFLQMCAARTGQILNLSSLANDCGITHNTAKSWISVLEASYVIFLVSPHFNNYNKRLIKSPKLYFYDTGLVCALMNIQEPQQLVTHSIRGALFETLVASEIIKNRFNQALLSNLYFWRDSQNHEVDFILEYGEKLVPIEVKSGQTITNHFFSGITYWESLSGQKGNGKLIYAGNQNFRRNDVDIICWENMDSVT